MRTAVSPTRIQAILFDLDGTLLDTEALSDKAMFACLSSAIPDSILDQHKDRRLPWDLKKQILGLRGAEWAPIVLDYARNVWGLPEPLPNASELWSSWEESLNLYCEDVQACPGALELVQKFAAAEVPMAIATSSRQAAVNKKRKNHEDMFQHFSAIVCGDHPSVTQGKPAPDIYLEAARQLSVSPNECLVFEDALTGVRSGNAAGGTVVAVPDPRFDHAEKSVFESEASMVLKDLLEFSGKPFGINVVMPSVSKS